MAVHIKTTSIMHTSAGVNIPTDRHSPLHSHEFFEILYVKSGHIYHRINAESAEMYSGDFIFLDLGDIHEYTCDTDPDLINLVFIPKSIDLSIGYCKNFAELLTTPYFNIPKKDLIHRVPKKIMHDDSGEILKLIECIKSETDNADIFTPQVVKYQIISFLLKILQPKYTGQREAEISELTIKLLQLIAEHYPNDNLLVMACDKLNYTLPYLSATFKRDMGIGFKDYLQNYRIDMAKKLLLHTDEKVFTICNRVGYQDIKYFSKLFKKYTNVTPSQYRHLITANHYQNI